LWPEKDRIIEIAMIKIFPDGHEETYETRIDPGMKIPAESLAIHGIEDKELVGKPKFKEVAHKIIGMMEGCDLGGFAIERLDIHILAKEFKHAGLDFDFGLCNFLDSQKIFHHYEKRNLSAAHELYLGKPLEDAHSALADARASLDVFKAQLEKYPDLPETAEELYQFTKSEGSGFLDETRRFRWWNGEVYFNFGGADVYGKSLRGVASEKQGFLEWMLKQTFSKEVKRIVEDALKGTFPEKS